MRTDCLLKVRWQQRMLRPDVKDNMSPQEQQVGALPVCLPVSRGKQGGALLCRGCAGTPSTRKKSLHVAVLAVSTSVVGDACGSVLMLKHSCTVLLPSLLCFWLPLQFYRDYDRALNGYMGVDSGIGMDLTLVSRQ